MKKEIQRRLELADAVWRLGPSWIAFRIRYEAEKRLGVLGRRSPIRAWPQTVPSNELSFPPIVAITNLTAWLRKNYDDDTVKTLRHHRDDLTTHIFDVFGHTVRLNSWHHDPVGDHTYESAPHWSEVPQHRGIDVKRVWEPSRFGWVYDLLRLHLIEPEAGAAETFWELFDSWCAENQPNAGINWACGQEASIRLMAVILAADVLRESLTPEQIGKLDRFAQVTGERVYSNIAYARSQKNNHHTSEAAGLVTVGALFPHLPNAEKLLRKGLKEMVDACDVLIMRDGGSSQYSSNYHRVFLHGMAWAATVLHSTGHPVPPELTTALKRATNYWTMLMNPISGLVPMIGHDDGANILPLARGVHKDARPADALMEAIANNRTVLDPGPWDEAPFWLGIDSANLRRDLIELPERGIVSFENMGIHILWNGDYRVIFRCGPIDFRPSQDDQLHVDIWWRGEALTTAPGTYSYNPPENRAVPSLLNVLVGGASTEMPAPRPFLFAGWDAGRLVSTCEKDGLVEMVGDRSETTEQLSRRIRLTRTHVEVCDRCMEPKIQRWSMSSDLTIRSQADTSTQKRDQPAGYGSTRTVEMQLFGPATEIRTQLRKLES